MEKKWLYKVENDKISVLLSLIVTVIFAAVTAVLHGFIITLVFTIVDKTIINIHFLIIISKTFDCFYTLFEYNLQKNKVFMRFHLLFTRLTS